MAPPMVRLMPEIGFGSRYVSLFAIAVAVTVAEMPGLLKVLRKRGLSHSRNNCLISITLAHVESYSHCSDFGTIKTSNLLSSKELPDNATLIDD